MPRVSLRFLAALREVAGAEQIEVEASTPRAALEALALWESVQAYTPLVAVNHEVTDWDQTLSDGDEVAFLPPMTGG